MKTINFFILGLIFLFISCAGIYPCRKQFTVFKESFPQSESNLPIKTNGIYVSINQNGSFYLFNNGYTKTISNNIPVGKKFWENPELEVNKLRSIEMDFETEVWGHYRISGDTIIIQTFGLNDQLCKRSVYETKGIILNDSTIKVFSDYSYWFDTEFIKEPNIYRLYKTEHKPDSTKAWFANRRWYQRDLHESRR